MLGDLPVPTALGSDGDLCSGLFLGRMPILGLLQSHCACFEDAIGVRGEETLPLGSPGRESKVLGPLGTQVVWGSWRRKV